MRPVSSSGAKREFSPLTSMFPAQPSPRPAPARCEKVSRATLRKTNTSSAPSSAAIRSSASRRWRSSISPGGVEHDRLVAEHAEQRRDHLGIELAAGVGAQLGDRGGVPEGAAVGPVGDHRVVGVAGEHDPARERDPLAGQAVRVAAPVPALVLVADRLRHLVHPRDLAQDLLADHRVVAHHPRLLGGQRSRSS